MSEVGLDDSFAEAMLVLERPGVERERFSAPFLKVFPVTGASVSTLGDVLGSEIVSATDADAEKLDELQFDLGEGPCWDALRLGGPVAVPDLPVEGRRRWPAFAEAARKVPVASIFAFPLAVGSLRLGAVDLYAQERTELTPDQSRQAAAMARVIGRQLLQEAVDTAGATDTAGSRYSRRVVHQATGIVLAQLDVTAEEAGLVVQGHAFARNRPVSDVAADVVAGCLNFRSVDGDIEAIE
ncbi:MULTISPECIES: GAF and ANTAR domain-containing protein [Microbacterium]|nr:MULTISPECIES: GAF and ANTAR domain-containing protein [Microbacterium]